jgi:hypothetical protein
MQTLEILGVPFSNYVQRASYKNTAPPPRVKK